jgi:hypothetical protein
MIYNWKTQYAVLTKNGTLYIMKNMYDAPADAEVRYELATQNVHVNGDLKSFSVELTCNTDRRFIRLSGTEEFASWLRTLGEFGTRGTSNAVTAQKEADRALRSERPQSGAQEPVPDRAGTKTDQLSAMYGI